MRRAAVTIALVVVTCGAACRREPTRELANATTEVNALSPDYIARVTLPPGVRPRVPTTLTITIKETSGATPRLELADDALLHVVAVSRDLNWHEHAHPQEVSDGRFEAPLTFPEDGQYVFFLEFQPAGSNSETSRVEWTLGSRRMARRSLRLTPADRSLGAYTIQLASSGALHADSWSALTFHVARSGTPVRNLDARAALGGLLIVDEDANDLVSSHSTIEEVQGGVRAGTHATLHPFVPDDIHLRQPLGPDLTFHAKFPRPGRYKVWTEFVAGKDKLMTDFVVIVK